MTKVTHDTTAERYLITVDAATPDMPTTSKAMAYATSTTPSSILNSAAKAFQNHSSRPHSTIPAPPATKYAHYAAQSPDSSRNTPNTGTLFNPKCNNPGPPA